MVMDPTVAKLTTVDDCLRLESNALARGRSDLARDARRRAIQIRAEQYGAATLAERECLEAVYAYEEVLRARHGKNVRASRTWQMIKRHGIIAAVERAVDRREETVGYSALVEMGLDDLAFERVVDRYPQLFSAGAVAHARARIADRK
jgi:hypothetical protein